jgi:hypothetical protein
VTTDTDTDPARAANAARTEETRAANARADHERREAQGRADDDRRTQVHMDRYGTTRADAEKAIAEQRAGINRQHEQRVAAHERVVEAHRNGRGGSTGSAGAVPAAPRGGVTAESVPGWVAAVRAWAADGQRISEQGTTLGITPAAQQGLSDAIALAESVATAVERAYRALTQAADATPRGAEQVTVQRARTP